mmetsp:Transcript_11592/g.10368  ORF Transcript_11592/g.10368 Transcript_11592/m.10368 type:complete len:89 (-) Transcript_11592:140-406(-)
MNSGQRPPKPQRGFWKPRQTSLTRKIIWHGSTAFLLCGFAWASYATFRNEATWRTEEYQKVKDYEKLVEQYKKDFENDPNNSNTNGAH